MAALAASGSGWGLAMALVVVPWGAAVAASDAAKRVISQRTNLAAACSVGAVMIGHGAVEGLWAQPLAAAAAGLCWGLAMEAISVARPDSSIGGGDARTGAWTLSATVWSFALFDSHGAGWSLGLFDGSAAMWRLGLIEGLMAIGVTQLAAALWGIATQWGAPLREMRVAFGVWLAAMAAAAPSVAALAGSGV